MSEDADRQRRRRERDRIFEEFDRRQSEIEITAALDDEDRADTIVARLRAAKNRPVTLNFSYVPGGALGVTRRLAHAIEAHGDCHGHAVYAHSSGALCWLACRTRSIEPGGSILLHYAHYNDLYLPSADVAVLRGLAERLKTANDWIRRRLTDALGMHPSVAHALLLEDRPIGPAEAFAIGLLPPVGGYLREQ